MRIFSQNNNNTILIFHKIEIILKLMCQDASLRQNKELKNLYKILLSADKINSYLSEMPSILSKKEIIKQNRLNKKLQFKLEQVNSSLTLFLLKR